MPYQATHELDLTTLITDPYEAQDYWKECQTTAEQQLGGSVLSMFPGLTMDKIKQVYGQNDHVIEETDPLFLEEEVEHGLNQAVARDMSINGWFHLGPLNHGEGKSLRLIQSTLVQADVAKANGIDISDENEVYKYILSGRLAPRVRNYIAQAEMTPNEKRNYIENVASQLQSSAVDAMMYSVGYWDDEYALRLLINANDIRSLRNSDEARFMAKKLGKLKSGKFRGYADERPDIEYESTKSVTTMLNLRRELDTSALALHAEARLGEVEIDTIHGAYRDLQQQATALWLESLKDPATRSPSLLFEWYFTLLDNYYVHHHGLYGEHFSYTSMPNEDFSREANPFGKGQGKKKKIHNNQRFDAVTYDRTDGTPRVSYKQMKLVVPEFIVPELLDDNRYRPQMGSYATPIEIVTAETDAHRRITTPDEWFSRKDKDDIAKGALDYFTLRVQRLHDYYANGTPINKFDHREFTYATDNEATIPLLVAAA